MSLWKRYCSFIEWTAEKSFMLSAVCLVLMVLPIVCDVIMRWTIGGSIHGIIEVEELLLLLLVFFSLSKPQIEQRHIDVDLVYGFLPASLQRGLYVFHWELCAVLVACIFQKIFVSAMEKMAGGEFTPEIYLPTAPFFFAASAGALLLLLSLIYCFGKAVIACVENRHYIALVTAIILPPIICALPWLLQDTPLAWEYLLTGGILFICLILLLFMRMPIGYAMAIIGLLGLMIIEENHLTPLHMLGMGVPGSVMSFTLGVVPLFILMGELALQAGISTDLFNAASKWLGHKPGGLAIASVTGCAGFAAICGDSLATAMTMSSVALPEMKKSNYNMGLSCACLAAGGTLGILIPPSVGFIFYAIITEESLGRLFLAGVVPGILLATLFCTALYIIATRHPELAPRGPEYPMSEKIRSLKGVIPMLGLVVLVLGGILFGFFSPNEGGAVGAFGTFVYALVSRRLTRNGFLSALYSTVSMTTKLFLILIGVGMLGYFFAASQIPFELADAVLAATTNKWLVFLLIVILYIALGCMLNVIPMILLTLPALYPTVQALGFDPIWFGVITVILMEMGQITPPMGLVVFAIAGMPNSAPMASIFRYIIIFVVCMLLCILLLTIFPGLALYLPSMLL